MWSTTVPEGEILKVGDVVFYLRRVKDGWATIVIDAPKELRIERVIGPPSSCAESPRPVLERGARRSQAG